MFVLHLSLRSLVNRRFSALLTIVAIALSVTLLLGVEKVRTEARASFAGTIAGTDLIVGPRTGSVQLLLYSVFRIGNPTSTMGWDSFQKVASHPRVAWAIPIALGDSHRGYPVVGTSTDYFVHYRHGRDRALTFTKGRPFAELYDAVIGAEVAREQGYRLGDELILGHGTGSVSFIDHADHPFRVSGILARTGTPVDRTVHISLAGQEAVHAHWQHGMPPRPQAAADHDHDHSHSHSHSHHEHDGDHQGFTPKTINAALLGLHSRVASFAVQRDIDRFPDEPLMAILPGVALQELWSLLGVAEKALFIVSVFVVLTGLIGMLTAILASLNERRREMAILRSVGARPRHVFSLLLLEAASLSGLGILLGLALMYGALWVAQPLIVAQYGVFIPVTAPSLRDWTLLGLILVAGVTMGCVPAWRAYRQSLVDGLSIRT